MDPATVIEYGIQIYKALKRAHEEGIIHRDIKPQNILLQSHDPSEPFVAKLADFGLAWGGSQSLISQTNMRAGTAYYRSPEQTLGGAKIDARSNIYSLGATRYHLLSGVPPIQLRMEQIPESMRAMISRSTESEWEYACRAGSRTAYCYGDEDSRRGDYAWYASNSENRTHPVGETESNAWGLQDMYGNVWEWCSDWYGDYPNAEVTDSTGPTSGSNRVFRGGCWFSGTSYCRSAFRGWDAPSCRYNDLGFRLALNT
jgi:serine/threonine protein kinase